MIVAATTVHDALMDEVAKIEIYLEMQETCPIGYVFALECCFP